MYMSNIDDLSMYVCELNYLLDSYSKIKYVFFLNGYFFV